MKKGARWPGLTAQLTLVTLAALLLSNCWIPLPEETAIIIQVFDSKGDPVDGASFILDSDSTITTGTQATAGQYFINLSDDQDHTLQLNTSSLLDPQGGVAWVPLASAISDSNPVPFANKPFAGGSNILLVPVNKGEITVATFYLDDILKSPMDNQWLTDGSDQGLSGYRPVDNADEFLDQPQPVFWWRPDPSIGSTVSYTFQLWSDDDGDTRYPLGIVGDPDDISVGHTRYINAMNPANAAYVQPDWEVPLAGVQRAEAGNLNQVVLWSGLAADGADLPTRYDIYYAPDTWSFNTPDYYPVLRNAIPSADGQAVMFTLGTGTVNDGVVLRNGVDYRFLIRARDSNSTLDTVLRSATARGLRKATPPGSPTQFSAPSLSVSGSTDGTIDVDVTCFQASSLRFYVAPGLAFTRRPFDPRFIWATTGCSAAPTTFTFTLGHLANNLEYAVAVEPFDSTGRNGAASSVVRSVPTLVSTADTTRPSKPSLTVSAGASPGHVVLDISAVTDSSETIRRLYWSPDTANKESMFFTVLDSVAATSLPALVFSLDDIPADRTFFYTVRAVDRFGNEDFDSDSQSFAWGDSVSPTWATDVPASSASPGAFFAAIAYVDTNTPARADTWDLGVSWAWGSAAGGFALGRDPVQGEGEYVWRVVQDGVAGVPVSTKLGAFYTYSGYYYADTAGDLAMSAASDSADHRSVFGFVESSLAAADIMGAFFDSGDPDGYRQRTAASFGTDLANGLGRANQVMVFYPTDGGGKATISAITIGGAGGNVVTFIDLLLLNKQSFVTPSPPRLQGKTLTLAYETPTGDRFLSPFPFSSQDLLYQTPLSLPDFQEPLW